LNDAVAVGNVVVVVAVVVAGVVRLRSDRRWFVVVVDGSR